MNSNLSSHIDYWAKLNPDKKAVTFPRKNDYSFYSFSELNSKIHGFAYYLKLNGVKPEDKVLLFVKPSLNFSALVFALFKMGAIPILIDPGMGKDNLLKSIAHVKPKVLIAEPVVFLLKHFYGNAFSSIKLSFSVGTKLTADFSLAHSPFDQEQDYPAYQNQDDDMVAILFTSGGTGIPKGVVYTQKIFETQIEKLKEMFKLTTNDVDCPGFPLFSLFTIAMGMTSCIPDMNPSKPAKANPKKLVKNILDSEASFIAGSPAIWERVGVYCYQRQIQLPSVKYLVMFGAPVSVALHELFKDILPNGTTYTPYGATESLPVACISGKEVLASTAALTKLGKGTCVGLPVNGTTIMIYETSDIPEGQIQSRRKKLVGEVGEILVQGDIATKEYFEMPGETKLAKIKDGDQFWHRIGDVGYKDEKGQLWFCGRKTHRVESSDYGVLYPIPCEAIFNQHPEVKRSALIALKKNDKIVPAMVVERNDHLMTMYHLKMKKFKDELLSLAQAQDHTKMIEDIFLYDYFPVDVRHNIKIDRIKLKNWANSL